MNYFLAPATKVATKVDTVIDLVCKDFEIDRSDLLSNKHHPEYARPRQVAIWLVRISCNIRGKEIEEVFNRGHTTISKSYSKVQDLMSVYPDFKQRVHNLLKYL